MSVASNPVSGTDPPAPASTRLLEFSAVERLCLVLGASLVIHYAWLMDDAYIYFRYVDNWVLLGRGLVFNEGEFVEGYSSPLWALLLGALRATGLDYWTIVRGIGVASFVCFFGLFKP